MKGLWMAWGAVILFNIGLVLAFGWQSWRQKRRTGSTGFVGLEAARSALQRFSSVGFVLALVLDEVALVFAATRAMEVADLPWLVRTFGLVLMLGGLALVFVAQVQMGDSWRIGVKQDEKTDLVTDGVFRIVRNPIFSGMLIANLGALLMAPTWLLLAGLVLLWVTIEIQVRQVEEPHLARAHGEAYRRYAASSGRFLPAMRR